jgi:trans-aconitate methyltransferase
MKKSPALEKMEREYSLDKIYSDRSRLAKEIAEIQAIEKFKYKMPRDGVIYDLACGHGMAGALVALNKPRALVIGIDKTPRNHWFMFYSIPNLLLVQGNIYEYPFIPEPDFIFSIHPCRELAIRVLDVAIDYGVPVVLMPCCIATSKLIEMNEKMPGIETFLKAYNHANVQEDVRYVNWTAGLAYYIEQHGYKVSIHRPKYLSKHTPMSMIIYAR